MDLHDGNIFFMHRYPSVDIERALERIDTFEQFEKFFTDDLMDENLLMGEYLRRLLDRYNINPTQAAKWIGKSHSYVRKIVNGDELNPSRDVLLALCVLMGATIEETQILLRYSGKQPLYARRKRDAIIWFSLKKRNGLNGLNELNDYLEKHDYETLNKIIVREEKD